MEIINVWDFLKKYPTIFLSVISAYLYLCAYAFESGYLHQFDISDDYLSIDLNTIILDSSRAIGLIIGTMCIYQLVQTPFLKWKTKSVIHEEIVSLFCRLVSISALALVALPVPNSWIKYFDLFGLLIIAVVAFFGLREYNREKKNEIIEDDNEKKLDDEGVLDLNKKRLSRYFDNYFLIAISFIIPIILSSFFGWGIATKVTNLPMINDSTRYLVVRKYGDQLLCKGFDYKNKKLSKQTIIIKIPINKPIVLIDYEIGNLFERSLFTNYKPGNRHIIKAIKPVKNSTDTLKL